MPTIVYKGNQYTIAEDESVLQGLLRHGEEIPYSCRSGACQTCMLKAVEGTPPSSSQIGLKQTVAAQGYFLSCQCYPEEDLTLDEPEEACHAAITNKERLNERVVRLELQPQSAFQYHAGQYIQLIRGDNLIRSYSLASLPHVDNKLDLHVLRVPEGRMSNWAHDEAQPGETISLRGPSGECFYVPGQPDQPLLLAGTGTGLAPLYGILRDALYHQHEGPIYLFHGSLDKEGLYLVDTLKQLESQYENLQYTPCFLHGDEDDGLVQGNIMDLALSVASNFKGWRVFLCGNPDTVFQLRRKVFLKGAAYKDILADAFIMSNDS